MVVGYFLVVFLLIGDGDFVEVIILLFLNDEYFFVIGKFFVVVCFFLEKES